MMMAFFGVIGIVRGFHRELGVTTMLLLALLVIKLVEDRFGHQFDGLLTLVTGDSATQLPGARAVVWVLFLIVIAFILYRGRSARLPRKGRHIGARAVDRVAERILVRRKPVVLPGSSRLAALAGVGALHGALRDPVPPAPAGIAELAFSDRDRRHHGAFQGVGMIASPSRCASQHGPSAGWLHLLPHAGRSAPGYPVPPGGHRWLGPVGHRGFAARDGFQRKRLRPGGGRGTCGPGQPQGSGPRRAPGKILPARIWCSSPPAVQADNPEVKAAQAAGIPVVKRSEFLGALMAGQAAGDWRGRHARQDFHRGDARADAVARRRLDPSSSWVGACRSSAWPARRRAQVMDRL